MSGLLMDEQFVAVFPSLVRHLGSIEAAAILQHMHFNADDQGAIKVTQQEISDATGIKLRTVERRVKELRDAEVLSSERSGSYDATLTYRIDHSRLDPEPHPAKVADSIPHPVKVADSEPVKVADSSSQNERSPVSNPLPTTQRPGCEPLRHSSRGIHHEWQPRREFISDLHLRYPDVALQAERNTFVDWYLSTGKTSRSWEAMFSVWVASKQEKIDTQEREGTDSLGVPLKQRGSRTTAAAPGDPDYVDPEEIIEAARQAAMRERSEA